MIRNVDTTTAEKRDGASESISESFSSFAISFIDTCNICTKHLLYIAKMAPKMTDSTVCTTEIKKIVQVCALMQQPRGLAL